MISYKLSETIYDAKLNVSKGKNNFVFKYPCNSLFSCTSYDVTFNRGKYFIELWGAEGSGVNLDCNRNKGGKGAYVSGYLTLDKTTNLLLFLGAEGYPYPQPQVGEAFNGGGYEHNAAMGGGGTDLRTSSSFVSRIMVAGAGGGSDCQGNGGHGGALKGLDSTNGDAKGGTQESGGSYGSLGKGGSINSGNPGSGGGGGYYGGGISSYDAYPGAGGSSYVSGFPLCKSVNEDGTVSDSYVHYSLLKFEQPMMLDGSQSFPSPYNSFETGHQGSGAARITIIKTCYRYITCKRSSKNMLPLFISTLIMMSC